MTSYADSDGHPQMCDCDKPTDEITTAHREWCRTYAQQAQPNRPGEPGNSRRLGKEINMAVSVQQRGRESLADNYDIGQQWEVTEHGVLEVKDLDGEVVASYHRDVWAKAWTVSE